jgi:DNA-binding NtrC family response regulator/anti-anti-sigma regulatory factor
VAESVDRGERSLKVTCLPRRGGYLIRLAGEINEHADLSEPLRGLTGTLVLDLDKITRVTSFGVVQWMRAMEQLGSTYCVFIKCRTAMITQFNLVRGFAGRGDIVSFYAPYICPACGQDFDLLLDLRHHHEVVLSGEPPFARCSACNEVAELNAIPEELFSYVSSRPRPQLSRTVQQIIDEVVGDVLDRLRVRKEVSASCTRLILTGPISRGLDSRHWFDGLEGVVVLDLSEVSLADEQGLSALTDALDRSDADRIYYDRVRCRLLPAIRASQGKLEKLKGLLSLAIEIDCPVCNDLVEFEIGSTELATAGETSVETCCPSCGSPRTIELGPSVISTARASIVPAPPDMKARSHHPVSVLGLQPSPSTTAPATGLATMGLIGDGARLRELEEKIRRVAESDVAVLLRGETGTGKELLARAVHQFSKRRQMPFVAVNCAALTDSLIESELFGHERGAFTGATERYLGRFERANGGTLFIDEVGDLPMRAQVKLLRALQEHTIERVGGHELIPVDIRLVAATHQPLEELIERSAFRRDLFYRLNVVPFFVAPLRERKDDIWPLAIHYLGHVQRRSGKSGIRFSEQSRRVLESHTWEGNVRELVNVVECAVALAPEGATIDLDPAKLPKTLGGAGSAEHARPSPSSDTHPAVELMPVATPLPRSESGPMTLRESVHEYERKLIADALARASGNRTRAAQRLGLSRQALGAKIAKYGL